jgi:type II secretory pathway pseudopilin PulG
MADHITETPHTTVIERRGSGGAVLIGIVLLLAVLIGGYFLLNQGKNDNLRTDAVTQAAKQVGDGAQKVGDSAQKAADGATKN